MKKTVIIISIFLLLTGCNASTSDITPAIYEKTPVSSLNSAIQSEKLSYIKIYVDTDYHGYQDISSWPEYFEQRTGIDLRINVLDHLDTDNPSTMQKDGAIYSNDTYYEYRVINDIPLTSLNKYYDLYNWYQYIDQAYIDLLKKGDDILAIPCISQPFVRARFYNKTYLDPYNLPVPETIDEFTEFLLGAHKINPRQYQMVISTTGLSRQLADVFRAYDIYVSTYNNSMIGFNPKTESFEDGVFSDNFKYAFSYVQELKERKILSFDFLSGGYGVKYQYPLATEYSMIYDTDYSYRANDQTTPVFDYEKGYFLKGINEEKLVEVRTVNSYFFFPESIRNMDAYMEIFNDVFASNEYFPDLAYGMLNKDYEISDDRITLIKKENDNLPRLFLSTIEPYTKPANMDMDGLAFLDTIPSMMTFSTNSLLDLLPVTFGVGYSTGTMPPTQFGSNYNVTAIDALYLRNSGRGYAGEVSEEEAIKEYKNRFMKEQINEYIDNLNERIGAKTSFIYKLDE